MEQPSYERRPLAPFNDDRVERYARSRVADVSMGAAANIAGIGRQMALRIEKSPEFRDRLHELRQASQTISTVSKAWLLEEFKRNATDAGTKAREAEGRDSAALFKVANDALEACVDLLTSDPALGDGGGRVTGRSSKDRRAELRARLGAGAAEAPIVTTAEDVPADEEAE